MAKRLLTVWAVVFVCCMFWGSAWAMKAAPVSPVGEEGVAVIGQNCPQFSWSYVEGAVGYEVVVFEGEERLSYEEKASFSEAQIEKVIASPGLTWSPEGGGCLKSGKGYVWYVRAVDAKGPGIWSEGARFRVDEKAMVEALREPVQEVVREYFSSEQVVKEKLVGLEGKIREEVKRELKGGRLIGVGSTPKELETQDSFNTFYGIGAGATIESGTGTGTNNSFFGINAGNKTTTGSNNTFLGRGAGFSNTTADINTFLGYHAGYSNTTGHENTFVGNDTGYHNTTGCCNAFLGDSAGHANTTGYNNTFLGNYTGFSNTTGDGNTFLGIGAGYANTTGYTNTYLGDNAGSANTTGNNNTFLGNFTGYLNTAGSGNVFLGVTAGYNETGSNKLYIDNSITNTPLIFGEFYYRYVVINGVLSIASSREYKENIDQLRTEEAMETLQNLKPVKFSYKVSPGERHAGFISEEVPESLTTRERKAVSPMDIVAVLTKVVQEQQKVVQEQQKSINELKTENEGLKAKNESVENRLLAIERMVIAPK